MAAALALGWSAAETGPDSIVVSDVDAERARGARRPRPAARAAGSNRDLAEPADVLVLATKPAALGAVAEETRVTVHERDLPVVSILGATPTRRDRAGLRRRAPPVLRFMPNVAAEVRAGHVLLRARRRRSTTGPSAACWTSSGCWAS